MEEDFRIPIVLCIEDFISQMRRSHPELSQEKIEKVLE